MAAFKVGHLVVINVIPRLNGVRHRERALTIGSRGVVQGVQDGKLLVAWRNAPLLWIDARCVKRDDDDVDLSDSTDVLDWLNS